MKHVRILEISERGGCEPFLMMSAPNRTGDIFKSCTICTLDPTPYRYHDEGEEDEDDDGDDDSNVAD